MRGRKQQEDSLRASGRSLPRCQTSPKCSGNFSAVVNASNLDNLNLFQPELENVRVRVSGRTVSLHCPGADVFMPIDSRLLHKDKSNLTDQFQQRAVRRDTNCETNTSCSFLKTPQISTDSETEINIMSSKYAEQTRQIETKTRQVIITTKQSLIKKCNLNEMQGSCQGIFCSSHNTLETNVR